MGFWCILMLFDFDLRTCGCSLHWAWLDLPKRKETCAGERSTRRGRWNDSDGSFTLQRLEDFPSCPGFSPRIWRALQWGGTGWQWTVADSLAVLAGHSYFDISCKKTECTFPNLPFFFVIFFPCGKCCSESIGPLVIPTQFPGPRVASWTESWEDRGQLRVVCHLTAIGRIKHGT